MAQQDSDKRHSVRAESAKPSEAVRQNDTGSSNTVVRNPAPDAAPPAASPEIYGTFTITR
jgi:hypothetical protein